MDRLDKMIANRETELQRAWDTYMAEKEAIVSQLANLLPLRAKLEDDLLTVNANLAKCRRRAKEQNCEHIL